MRRIGPGWALVTMPLLFPACGDSGSVGGLPPAGAFLPGDFGPVLASPDRELLVVRSIEPGDTWIVDEFGRQHRPRLSLVRTLLGTLQPINERTGVVVMGVCGMDGSVDLMKTTEETRRSLGGLVDFSSSSLPRGKTASC